LSLSPGGEGGIPERPHRAVAGRGGRQHNKKRPFLFGAFFLPPHSPAIKYHPSPAPPLPLSPSPQSFTIHIGGNLRLPSRPRPAVAPTTAAAPAPTTRFRDVFEGVPLAAWAERLGARVVASPAYEAIQADQAAQKAAVRAGAAAEAPPMLSVPHLLPFTRWASSSPSVRATLVAPPAADRPKARLSWYHPDDGMVPRGWWKGGLLADLAYYKPFAAVEEVAA